MNIKQGARTQKDVKNEGCSQDLIENKWQKTTQFDLANMLMKINSLSIMPICL
jgi:hypothetical protein